MSAAKLQAFDATTVRLSMFAKALAHPARITILRQVAQHGELVFHHIAEHLPLSQATISEHVNVLKKAELLTATAKGQYVHYRLNTKVMNKFCSAMGKALHQYTK